MKITYHKNPLYTTVALDEHEKKELWHTIRFQQMQELLFDVHFHLQEGEYFDLNEARQMAAPDYYMGEDATQKSQLDARCDMLLDYYLCELMGSHAGDCTCFPCSCGKCHAEDLLGIHTIKGLGKHAAHKILSAFGPNNEKTIEEALASLAQYTPIKSNAWSAFAQEDFDKHVPRWTAESKAAYDWLLAYRNTHFSTHTKLSQTG